MSNLTSGCKKGVCSSPKYSLSVGGLHELEGESANGASHTHAHTCVNCSRRARYFDHNSLSMHSGDDKIPYYFSSLEKMYFNRYHLTSYVVSIDGGTGDVTFSALFNFRWKCVLPNKKYQSFVCFAEKGGGKMHQKLLFILFCKTLHQNDVTQKPEKVISCSWVETHTKKEIKETLFVME